MSFPFLPLRGMPSELNNFRTLVAQYRGYHFFSAAELPLRFITDVIGEKYYTGLTFRLFGWIGDTTGSFDLYLGSSDYVYKIGFMIEGSKVTVHDNQAQNLTMIPKPNLLQVPGYFTLALRFEQPSHIHVIFGEKEVIHRARVPYLLDRWWRYFFIPTGSVSGLSTHMSDEQGKGSSTLSLKPGRMLWPSTRMSLVVIECQIDDTSQDLWVSLPQDTGEDLKTSFRTSHLQQNDEAVITVRDTRDGWLVGTSFCPDFRLVKGVSNKYLTFPIISENFKVHRMRWEYQR